MLVDYPTHNERRTQRSKLCLYNSHTKNDTSKRKEEHQEEQPRRATRCTSTALSKCFVPCVIRFKTHHGQDISNSSSCTVISTPEPRPLLSMVMMPASMPACPCCKQQVLYGQASQHRTHIARYYTPKFLFACRESHQKRDPFTLPVPLKDHRLVFSQKSAEKLRKYNTTQTRLQKHNHRFLSDKQKPQGKNMHLIGLIVVQMPSTELSKPQLHGQQKVICDSRTRLQRLGY